MSHNGSAALDEQQLTRQRVCDGCQAYVSFTRIDSLNCMCPLCNKRFPMSPNFVNFMSAQAIAKILAEK